VKAGKELLTAAAWVMQPKPRQSTSTQPPTSQFKLLRIEVLESCQAYLAVAEIERPDLWTIFTTQLAASSAAASPPK